ncbi:MAG TPA: hypothetical protein VF334_19225 [Polyangia bacterium]
MRFLAPLVLSSLVSTVALADPAVAVIDDEPAPQAATSSSSTAARATARHAPADTGELRSARIAAPAPVAVKDNAGVAREHTVAPAQTAAPTAVDADDVVAELAAHQMKRHQRALDGCLAAAHKRTPGVTGTLALDFEIADRKVKSVSVSENSAHDSELARCLTTTARGFTFSLASARFRWPLALQP